jgi:hypothetical protein
VSGLLLSLAFVFGGIWLTRSNFGSRTVKGAVAGAATFAILSGATFCLANAGPPDEARSITGKMFSQAVHVYGFGWGQVRLEIGNGDRVQLIVPNPKEKSGDE